MQKNPVEMTGGMSLREVLAIAFREKRKIIIAALIPPVIAIGLLLVLKPTYRAETGLVIKTGREYIAAGQGQSSALGPSSTLQEEVNTEIQIMTSRGVLEKVVNKIGVANIYPDGGFNLLISGTPEDAAIERLSKTLEVQPVKLSNVLSLTFDHDDPKMATRVLTEIVDAYQAAHLDVYAGNRARAYQDGIQREIGELDQLEHDRAKIKVDNQVYDIALQRASLIAQRSDAQSHLQDSQTRLVTLQKRLSSLGTTRKGIKTDVTSADTAKNELEYSQNALTDLRARRDGAARTLLAGQSAGQAGPRADSRRRASYRDAEPIGGRDQIRSGHADRPDRSADRGRPDRIRAASGRDHRIHRPGSRRSARSWSGSRRSIPICAS